MALGKFVRVGGSLFEGFSLPVLATPGDYSLIISNTSGICISGISVTPDVYGPGDRWKLQHMSDASGTGNVKQILARNIPNLGANAGAVLDLPSLQNIKNNESLKLTYTNTASKALNLYVIVEWVGITITA